MRKFSLFPVTLLTLLATGWVLNHAGWFAKKHVPVRKAEPRRQAQAADPFASEAAYRYRTGQPHHWRAFVLNR